MRPQINMNTFLYSLLVDLQMDDFTVAEAKDALLNRFEEFIDPIETRKFIYRLLLNHETKGYLDRSKTASGSNTVIYSKTQKFFDTRFVAVKRSQPNAKRVVEKTKQTVNESLNHLEMLNKSLFEYERDNNVLIQIGHQYKQLKTQMPHLADELEIKRSAAREQSIILEAKITATKHAIELQTAFEAKAESKC